MFRIFLITQLIKFNRSLKLEVNQFKAKIKGKFELKIGSLIKLCIKILNLGKEQEKSFVIIQKL